MFNKGEIRLAKFELGPINSGFNPSGLGMGDACPGNVRAILFMLFSKSRYL